MTMSFGRRAWLSVIALVLVLVTLLAVDPPDAGAAFDAPDAGPDEDR